MEVMRTALNVERKIVWDDRRCSKLLEVLILDKHVKVFPPNPAMEIFAPTLDWTVERFLANQLSGLKLVHYYN